MNPDYDYTQAGFDSFLSRSIDNLSQVNLDSQGPRSTAIRYDSAQVSGMLGDSLQIGGVRINRTNIIINDGSNDFLLMGEDISWNIVKSKIVIVFM